MRLEYICLNCGAKIVDTPSQQRKFCSTKCYIEYRKEHGLSKTHKESLSKSISEWWKKVKKENPDYLSWRSDRIKSALRKIPDEKHSQRYAKISSALKGRKPVNTGVRVGDYVNCLQCGKRFYREPSSSKKFCSRKCWRIYNKEHWHELHPTVNKYLYKETIIKERQGRCESCGFSDTRILIVHHKDENDKNNLRENLLVLCPNCHFIMHLNEKGKVNFRKVYRL